MAIGRGKYGGIAEEIQERFKAKATLVVICDGARGHGIELHGPPEWHLGLPDLLEALARDVRRQAQADYAAIKAGEAAMSEAKQ